MPGEVRIHTADRAIHFAFGDPDRIREMLRAGEPVRVDSNINARVTPPYELRCCTAPLYVTYESAR